MNWNRITVLSPSLTLTSIVAISSALAKIAQAFPEVSVSAVQMLTTLPSFTAVVVILLSGYLSSWLRKKRIVVISVGLMLAGGLMPLVFHQNFTQLIFAGIVFGLGYGGVSPMTTALIHEHYSQAEQPAMLGFQSAVIGIGGVLFSYLGGKLAAVCWWYAYFSYLLFIPVFLLVLRLPEGNLAKQESRSFHNLLNGKLLFYLGQGVVFAAFFYVFQTNLALLVEARGLGGAQTAGTVLSTQSAVGILSGILGGKILGKLKNMSLACIFAVSGLALLLIYLSGSLVPIYIAAACLGFVFSLRMPAGYLKATSSVSPECATLAITVYCSFSQVGQFLSPLCVNGLANLAGGGLETKFLLSALVLLLAGAVSVVWKLKTGTSPKKVK